MERMVDLHVHTSYSDSVYSPEEVLRISREKGLVAVGICDHDSVGGVDEALELAGKHGVEVIPGVELSTELGGREVHILGYFLDWKDKHFQALLKTIREVRRWRAELMVSKLKQLGFNLEFEEVLEESKKGSIGRPHVARVMLRRGYVQSIDEAFDRYLKHGGAAYVPKYQMLPEDAIGLIKKLRGIAVLAHPKYGGPSEGELRGLVEQGLRGIEVYHTKHSPEETRRYQELAERYGLLVTGGSDSHGAEDPIGGVRLPYEYLQRLKDERWRALFG